MGEATLGVGFIDSARRTPPRPSKDEIMQFLRAFDTDQEQPDPFTAKVLLWLRSLSDGGAAVK